MIPRPVVYMLILWILVLMYDKYIDTSPSKQELNYSRQCDENKGIAVRDLEGKMRCVPMFSAIRKGQP